VIAYRKFSDTLQNEDRASTPPKPAKTPKVDPIEPPQARTLGGLGALGGVAGETGNPPPSADTAPAIWGEAEAERAAIIEHDGGIPRDWAAGFARLDRDRPPGDVPPRRWQRFVDDVGLFLDGPFGAVAAAFGWGALDLFGCGCDRPFARIDQAGLLWLLAGNKLFAMTENTATRPVAAAAEEVEPSRPSACRYGPTEPRSPPAPRRAWRAGWHSCAASRGNWQAGQSSPQRKPQQAGAVARTCPKAFRCCAGTGGRCLAGPRQVRR
jgi:hypothetical protein